MPKLKISDRERQNRTLIAIIQSGKEMEDISVQKLASCLRKVLFRIQMAQSHTT